MIATFPPVIDSTMRSSFLLCPHHFFRRHCQGLVVPREAISVHLHFGGCLARGLEATRRSYHSTGSPEEAVLRGTEALIQHWGDYIPPIDPTRSEATKTLDACVLALHDYFVEWPLATDPVQIAVIEQEPCIEFSGAIPIADLRHPVTNEPLLYSGKFDLLGVFENAHWGLDDKTTGYAVSNWADQWKLRGQFTGYSYIAREWGVPLAGFLVRGIQPLARSTRLIPTVLISMPPWKLDQWMAQLIHDVQRMLSYWETGKWPQILDAGCYRYNRTCEFMPLCSSPHPERWEGEYNVEHWDPIPRGNIL